MVIKGAGIVTTTNGHVSVKFIPDNAEVIEVSRELVEHWVESINLLKDVQTLLKGMQKDE